MTHVDALSRAVAYIEAMPLEKEFQYRQLQDPKLKLIAESLSHEEHEKFELFDDLVYRKDTRTSRLYRNKRFKILSAITTTIWLIVIRRKRFKEFMLIIVSPRIKRK